jgi:predicted nucleotidyltransferase
MADRNTEKVFRVINKMYQEKILKDYAIGGAVATIYYTEPFATKDVDIFFTPLEKEKIILLTPFYDFLLKKGYKTYKEYIIIGETPIQFIPATNELEKEAVEKAIFVKYENIELKILRPEYLIAIFLRVYRAKDREKIIKLLDQAKIEKTFLSDILKRHNLDKKFAEFMKKYYGK